MDAVIEGLVESCRVATPHDAVLNSECAYTFHSPFTTDKGIVVNLNTFVGTVDELAMTKSSSSVHNRDIFVRIVKQRVPKEKANDMETTTTDGRQQPTKLGIGVDGGFATEDSAFDIVSTYSIVVLEKNGDDKVKIIADLPYNETTKASFPEAVSKSADSVICHSGMAVQQDLKVWELDEEPKPVSNYCENLPFVDNGVKINPDPSTWKCEASGDTDNLWLNLSDGYIGGGRKNWDGSGGSNGALDHYVATGEKYPLVVKLGTITADVSTADCYSYAKDEDGPVLIPNLAELLDKRGIHVGSMQKTVKSTAELEVELNATYAFDAITEAGAHLVPVSGPGLQGLQNLGNSCYMNSVGQLLLSGTVPELAKRYGTEPDKSITSHSLLTSVSPKDASSDLLCQTTKLSSALTSGVFAGPPPESATVTDAKSSTDPKYRLQPRMFKHVVAGNHVEFRTGQQQDASHFLQYMLEQLDRAEMSAAASQRLVTPATGSDGPLHVASSLFNFGTTARIACLADNRIKYKESAPETMWSIRLPMQKAVVVVAEEEPELKRQKSEDESKPEKPVPTITFQSCLDSWAADTALDDYRWPHLNNQVSPAMQQNRLTNFPRYLLIQMQRYTMGDDWTPQKLEVNLDIPEEIDLTALKATGPQDGEELVPEEDDSAAANAPPNAQPTIDEVALAQLMDMGFGINGCKRALTAVGGSNVEAAMNWVFEHNSDPDFNDPMPDAGSAAAAPSGGDSGVDDGAVMSLVENLGCFTMDQVRAALKETSGAADRAADWLFSHMDDLDGAIAALESKQASSSTGVTPSVPLEDGAGQYIMIGMISHIGKHPGSGHYVAHLKRDDKWVIFNDEKVALSESPPFQHAFIYLFQRKDTLGSPHPSY